MATVRCLLAGGTGFLGRNLAVMLANEGHIVTVLARPGASLNMMRHEFTTLKYLPIDLERTTEQTEILCDQDVLVYLVHSPNRVGSSARFQLDVQDNLPPLLSALRMFEQTKPKRVVFISSGGTVYGIPQRLPIPEDHPTNPISTYGAIKLAMEHFVRVASAQMNIESTVLRLSNPYGPGQEVQFAPGVIAAFLTNVIQGEPLEVWGNVENVRDYIYASDACRAIALAITRPLDDKHITLNVGSGTGTTVTELIQTIQAVTGKQPIIRPMAARPADVTTNILDISKAKSVLGFSPKHDLYQGISAYYTYLLNRIPKTN